jgi:hypothetical protein
MDQWGMGDGFGKSHHRPMTREQGASRRATWSEAVIAGLAVLGVAIALVRVSVENNGAIIAPFLAGAVFVAVFAARSRVSSPTGRSVLALIARGLVVVGLVLVAALAALLLALSNRGA